MQEKALNEILVGKACNGLVSVLENRNCNEGLGTKPILRCNGSRRKSETSFHSIHKNESRSHTRSIHSLHLVSKR